MALAASAGLVGPLRIGRLPQGAPVLAGAVEHLRLRRRGRQQQPDEDAGQRGVHTRGVHRQPERDPGEHVGRQAPDPGPPEPQQDGDQRPGHHQRGQVEVVAVEERHDGDGADVVDDRQGQQEEPEAVGAARAEEREDAEDERRVGRHDDAPAGAGRPGRVEREVHRGGDDETAEGAQCRRRQVAAVAEFAGGDLAGDLQADHEEEQRHRGVVDPVLEVEGEREVAHADRGGSGPERLVGAGPGGVGPRQRRQRGGEQERRAAGLGAHVEPRGRREGREGDPLGGPGTGRLGHVEQGGHAHVRGRGGRTSRPAGRRSVRCGRRPGRGSRPRRRCAPRARRRPRSAAPPASPSARGRR